MVFWVKSAVEIVILFLTFYFLIRSLQGTQGEGIVKGYVFLFVLIFSALILLVRYFSFYNFEFVLSRFLGIYLVAMVVIFQPELRNGLIQLGQLLFGRILEGQRSQKEIALAMHFLATRKIGALIAIEREIGLRDYMQQGIVIDARISKELICSIFWPGCPLHDGGVIIQNGRIAASSCIFPLTEKNLSVLFGTRHRAALGLTEVTDALVIVVSEERGEISFCIHGKMEERVSLKRLEAILKEFFLEGTPPPSSPDLSKKVEVSQEKSEDENKRNTV